MSKQIAYIAHCILNQNAVINGWERADGAFNHLMMQLLERDIAVIQLPCPEFSFLGEARPPMTKAEYNDLKDYRQHCHALAKPVVEQMKVYLSKGYTLVGLIGIGSSPSCSIHGERGVFAEVLISLMTEASITIPYIDIPESYEEGKSIFKLEI